jgi:hypothetical protein
MSEQHGVPAAKPFIGSDRRAEILSRLAARAAANHTRNKPGGDRRAFAAKCYQADSEGHSKRATQGDKRKGRHQGA